jgi:hypothetical protein
MLPDLLQLTCSFLDPNVIVRNTHGAAGLVHTLRMQEEIRRAGALHFISDFYLFQLRFAGSVSMVPCRSRSKFGMLLQISQLELWEMEDVIFNLMRFYGPISSLPIF